VGSIIRRDKTFGELDFEKMRLNTNLNHPRIVSQEKDGTIKFKNIPWTIGIGSLWDNVFKKEV